MIKLVLNRRHVGSAIISISRTFLMIVIPPTCGRVNEFYQCRFLRNEKLSWGGVSSQAVLSRNLETALASRQLGEAWESFWDFKKLYGFPEDPLLLHGLVIELSCSSDPRWLRKACDLVSLVSEEKPRLLCMEPLARLCLSLARAQLTNRAVEILRLMLEKDMLPRMNILRLVAMHLVKTEVGTRLMSNFVAQLCESRRILTKPDTVVFNLVLDACARFKMGFRGERVIESMAKTGVVADGHSILIISRIHEMNCQRDELKNYKTHVDRVSSQLVCHYRQFYDVLLNLHFKFNDIGSATELMWEFCRYDESLRKSSKRAFLVPIGSHNLKDGLKVRIEPELIQKDTVFKVENRQEFVMFRDGKLVLTNKSIAKLVKAFKMSGDVSTLPKLLLGIQTELCSERGPHLCRDVIEACIRLGWLEFAHDILDDVEASNAHVSSTTYILLLTVYFKRKRLREAKGLLAQMGRPGMGTNLPDKFIIIDYLSDVNARKPDLVEAFVRENTDEKHKIPSTVYELNSTVRFFCKAKMIDDAMRTYRALRGTKVRPTIETFANLVSMFSSMEMYRDITFLWGDMKRSVEHGDLVVNEDFFEYLLICFLRGGYFERVMEVIGYLNKHGMFIDKSMCKSEFLKLHKNLYRSLKASESRTEAQSNRLRYILAFKKWASIERSFQRKLNTVRVHN